MADVYGTKTNGCLYKHNWMHLLVTGEKSIVKYKIQIFHDILL